jgi:hypothetical protein
MGEIIRRADSAVTAVAGGGGGVVIEQQEGQQGRGKKQQQGKKPGQEVQQLQSLVLDWGLADRLEMLQRGGGEGEGEGGNQQGGGNAPPPRWGVLWCEMCGVLGRGGLRELQVTGMRWCPKQVRGVTLR